MSKKAKTKDLFLTIVVATILVVSLFALSKVVFSSYEFRDWLCRVTAGKKCYGVKVIVHLPDSGDRKRIQNENLESNE